MSTVYCFPSGPLETNAYLVVDDMSCAFLIDPAYGSFPFVETYLKQNSISLQALCCTHSHWDHVSDAHPYLQAHPHIHLFAHQLDEENLRIPGADGIPQPVPFPPIIQEKISFYEPTFVCGSTRWTIIHTPGHSPGSVCLFDPVQNILFSGDTLFCGTFGATSFPTSSRHDMYLSLQKLLDLPDDVTVYPGHGSEMLLKTQKAWMGKVVRAKLKVV